MIYKNGEMAIVVCCDCGLTHLWIFQVQRGTTSDQDIINVIIHRDDMKTKKTREICNYIEKERKGVLQAAELLYRKGNGT